MKKKRLKISARGHVKPKPTQIQLDLLAAIERQGLSLAQVSQSIPRWHRHYAARIVKGTEGNASFRRLQAIVDAAGLMVVFKAKGDA